jgi:transketolase
MLSRKELANAIRILSVDAVEKARSGHPGAPMGMADMAEVLWRDFLKHNPKNPYWVNRDRFVLSNGHASMLLYSLLHLTGYDLSLEDLQQFRQWRSKTPGHPEVTETPGVETTTGPLGQGLANAVGMALAEQCLAAQFNRPGYPIVDHHTYAFVGDGCLMEGISHEVCSLAGTLKLGKLIVFYDDNGISIDGEVQGWFSEDTAGRFKAYGWHVMRAVEGHHSEAIVAATQQARQVTDRPSLILCKTTIGYGAPNQAGSHECHGSPLGAVETEAVRQQLGWLAPPFVISTEQYQQWDATQQGDLFEQQWQALWQGYQATYPQLAAEFERRTQGRLPVDWSAQMSQWIQRLQDTPAQIATRKASQNVLEQIGLGLPELLGGSADLTPSNLTTWSGSVALNSTPSGNYLHYGVREFGMSAMMNGIALHGGFIPYGATFLVFTDYARNAVRLAALMRQRVIFIYTHDSIGLGEDGPTHQPIEQLALLRLTPHLMTWRPCDQVETAIAWQAAIEYTQGPSALVLSRQNLPLQPRTAEQLATIQRGGYILCDTEGAPDLILIATGSEVSLAVAAYQQLQRQGYRVRVVSMPSTERFDQQPVAYRETVLPPSVTARLAIEAATSDYWYRYVGLSGKVIGMQGFGASAPAEQLFTHFGFTVEKVLQYSLELLISLGP